MVRIHKPPPSPPREGGDPHPPKFATPWEPKAGVSSPMQETIDEAQIHEAMILERLRWERRQSVRRYALVMLLALLGGMIGGISSALTLLYYLN